MLVFLRHFLSFCSFTTFYWDTGASRAVGMGGTILRTPNQCGRRRKVPKMSHVLSSIQ